MSLSNSNNSDNNLVAQYKSWSASRILEILENTRGRRREQHFDSNLERIWCQREEELTLYAERYPMLTQRLLTCLLYSDRFITLESAKDNVVRHVAEMCKYAMHVHDEYTKQIRTINLNNSICFNDNQYYNNSQCDSDDDDDDDISNVVRESHSGINQELYMTIVKTLLRRPPSEVTFAATFANSLLSQSTLPIVHDLLENLLSEPEDFILHRWLHLPLHSEEKHLLQTKKSVKVNIEKSNNESEQERQEQHTLQNHCTTVKDEQGESQHFLSTMREVLFDIIYNCSDRATDTYSVTEYCKNRPRNKAISIHSLQPIMDNAKTESYEEEEEKLEPKILQKKVRKGSPDEKATTESVHREACNAVVNNRVQLQNVFRQGTFVKWAKQHTHNMHQWQPFIKSLPAPVKTRSTEEVYKLIQKHNVSKQNTTSTSSTNVKNDSKNLTNIHSSATSTISHVHVAIPEWIDKTDSDTDKDDITDNATMKVDNNTNNNNSTKIETEIEIETKIVNATNTNSSNSSSSVAPLAPVTWVQNGELTLKDGKFVILPTSAETRHRKRQHPITTSTTSNEQVSAFAKSNNNNCDVTENSVKANVTVSHGGSDKMMRSVYETGELTQNEQVQEIMEKEKVKKPESESEKKVNSIASFELSAGNSVNATGTNYNNYISERRTTEVVQEENTPTFDKMNNHKVTERTKRQRTSKQNKAETQKTGMHRRHNKSNTSTMINNKNKHNTRSKVRNSKHKKIDNHSSINSNQSNDHNELLADSKTMKVVSTHNVPLLSREMLWELLHHRWNISSTLQDALSIGLESNTSVIGDKIKISNSNGHSNDIFTNSTTTNNNDVSNTSVIVTSDHAKEDNTHTVLSSEQKEQQQVEQKANDLPDSVEIVDSLSESTTYDSSSLRSHSSRESMPSSASSVMSSSRSSQSFDFADEDGNYNDMGDFIIT